jgi:2,4-dienoyl-CoA reductase-like NADH-dependent reductase (Old Yellow Enzyme family)
MESDGRITQGWTGLWCDEQISEPKRIAGVIRAEGAVPAIQLAHAGREGSSPRPWRGGEALGDPGPNAAGTVAYGGAEPAARQSAVARKSRLSKASRRAGRASRRFPHAMSPGAGALRGHGAAPGAGGSGRA